MDWLKGMNDIIEYIEENLTQTIRYETLSRIVGCSVYEFSRIFSFMAGISVSEYIRRRRLSQAVFDIRKGSEKIIDIALKYGYESPTTFTRAFKELHGVTPISARKPGMSLKTYPPITFVLTIKGVNEMKFRIEKKESFQIMGLSGYETLECKPDSGLTPLWNEFLTSYDARFANRCGDSYYTAPLWQVGAYDFQSKDGRIKTIIGAEYKGGMPEGVSLQTVPAATWAVFSINSPTGHEHYDAAYARIQTEWFPASRFRRNEQVPNLDVYPPGNVNSKDYTWEIWVPVAD